MKKLRIARETKERILRDLTEIAKKQYVDGIAAGLKKSKSVAKEMEALMRYYYEKGFEDGENAERNFDKRLTAQH